MKMVRLHFTDERVKREIRICLVRKERKKKSVIIYAYLSIKQHNIIFKTMKGEMYKIEYQTWA